MCFFTTFREPIGEAIHFSRIGGGVGRSSHQEQCVGQSPEKAWIATWNNLSNFLTKMIVPVESDPRIPHLGSECECSGALSAC
jgi:hypothetical protein